jgi:uncharacterized delta-60 repeat protein
MMRRVLSCLGFLVWVASSPGQFLRVDQGFAPTLNGSAYAIGIQDDGKVLIGGPFTYINEMERSNFARLHSDGSLDPTFRVTDQISGWIARIVLNDSNVYASVLDPKGVRRFNLNGELESAFAVGSAFAVNSRRSFFWGVKNEAYYFNRVGRFNEDGSRDASFSLFVGCCRNMGINAVAIQKDAGQEKVLLGGYFTEVGTNQYLGLARLNENGSVDTNFAGQASHEVNLLQVWKNGKFYTASRYYLKRHLPDGSIDSTFSTMVARSGTDFSEFAVQDDGSVIALEVSPWSASFIARSRPDGSIDTDVSLEIDGPTYAFALQPDGGILLGGNFRSVNCISRPFLVRLLWSDTPDAPCPPPPPPPPGLWLDVSRIPGAKIVCCWPTNYPEYTLQATKRLRPNHPEKEKWVTVTNLPVQGESTVCVTNRILRWGRHYRLSK